MIVRSMSHRRLAAARTGPHTGGMANRLFAVLASIAGLAVFTFPGVLTPTVVPADRACAGGICDVCPAVAQVVSATGAQLYCLA